MKLGRKSKILFLALVVALLAGGFFYGGFLFADFKEKPQAVSPDEPLKTDFSLFWDSVGIIKNKYVGINNVKDQDILYGAIKGVLRSLDDPYSVFFNPSDAKKLNQDLSGSFGGIGAEIGIRNNQLLIIAPLKGNPAEKAGLRAGDKILKVDETVTADLTIDEAVKLIRGEPDTTVVLFILRDGWDESKEIKIVRQIIIVPTLDWEMRPGEIVHIRLYNFNANAPKLFYEAGLGVLVKGAQGIILDLRNNPGGFLEVANNIAGWFLKRGDLIVREQFRPGAYRDFRADGNSALYSLPVVVLINSGSASASEIVSGALRDNRGVKLIGEKTFGKGTVQEVETLKDGSSIKISVAAWLTPQGHEIDKKGLAPDIEVKVTDEDIEKGRDPQLEKALEILKEEIKNSPRIVIIPITN